MKNMGDRFSGPPPSLWDAYTVFMVRQTIHHGAIHQWITFN